LALILIDARYGIRTSIFKEEKRLAKIVTVEQMLAVEQAADEGGLSYDQMMANAGRSVAQAILSHVPTIKDRRILILTGSGNNGGDGLVAGHHLAEAGGQVSVYLAKDRGTDSHLERLRERELLIAEADQDQRWRVLTNSLNTADIVIDAIFGTGLKLPLRGQAQEVLAKVSRALEQRKDRPLVVAVDCPSGLDTDTGQIADEAIPADLTITLAAAKIGLLRFPGAEYTGEVIVGDIGLDQGMPELERVDLDLADKDYVRDWMPERPRDSHKGTFGTVFVVGGSINLPGAAALAGIGAYRVGAGLVTLAVPSAIQGMLAPQLPEATWLLLPHELGLINETAVEVLMPELEGVQAALLGPGLGYDKVTRRFLSKLFGLEVSSNRGRLGFVADEEEAKPSELNIPPLVIDADGLKLMAEIPDWPQRLPEGTILTPHPGEMAILAGEEKEKLQADRIETAKRYAAEWGHILVLKGAFTVVAEPNGRTCVIPVATSALASAGTGDVLAGIILGLRGQAVEPYEAACLGAYLHGRAGQLAALMLGNEASVLAGDLADSLSDAINELVTEG
jgi:NAD(P)H-hydrate epimerase